MSFEIYSLISFCKRPNSRRISQEFVQLKAYELLIREFNWVSKFKMCDFRSPAILVILSSSLIQSSEPNTILISFKISFFSLFGESSVFVRSNSSIYSCKESILKSNVSILMLKLFKSCSACLSLILLLSSRTLCSLRTLAI